MAHKKPGRSGTKTPKTVKAALKRARNIPTRSKKPMAKPKKARGKPKKIGY